MSSTISFKNPKLKDKTVEIKQKAPVNAVLKYSTKQNLPLKEEKNVIIYTDTAELFYGAGSGRTLQKLSDIVVVDSIEQLPDFGLPEKLFVAKSEKTLFFWDGDAYQTMAGGSGGGTVTPTKIFEYESIMVFPAAGVEKSIYIAKDNDVMYRFDATSKRYIQLARQTTDTTLSNKVNALENTVSGKADKIELTSFRKMSDKITESDLATSFVNRVGATETALVNKADKIDLTGKADKAELIGYRKSNDKIAENDLAQTVIDKINAAATPYDDTSVRTYLHDLDTTKADKSELVSYRKMVDVITETDLTQAVRDKLNGIGAGTGYDDTGIKADIVTLQDSKADKSALSMKADITALADLATKTELDVKADASALTDYRKKNDRIAETDLSQEVRDKLNSIGSEPGYDDSLVKADIAELQTNKADKSVLTSLATTVYNKADKSELSIVANAVNLKAEAEVVMSLQTIVANKADASSVTGLQSTISTVQGDLAGVQAGLEQKADTAVLTANVAKVASLEEQLAAAFARIVALEGGSGELKNILSFFALSPINVAYGTPFNSLGLPAKTTVNLSDSSTAQINTTWHQGLFDPAVTGTYTLTGDIVLPAGISNTNNIKPTISVTVKPQDAGSPYEWEYEFVLSGFEGVQIMLSEISEWNPAHKFTLEEFYGTDYNGSDNKVEVRWIGYEANRIHDPNGVPHPTSIEFAAGETKLSPDGAVDYDNETEIISFGGSSMGNRIYKLVKYK